MIEADRELIPYFAAVRRLQEFLYSAPAHRIDRGQARELLIQTKRLFSTGKAVLRRDQFGNLPKSFDQAVSRICRINPNWHIDHRWYDQVVQAHDDFVLHSSLQAEDLDAVANSN